jgi:bifunctional ADP-heptose synthase (sugar kinase/adenylyltransferase)
VVAVCIASGLSIFEAAKLGNLAGGLVCEEVGVVPINKALLLKEASLV